MTSPIDSASQALSVTASPPGTHHDPPRTTPSTRLPAELHHPFRFLAIAWRLLGGGAAATPGDDARRAAALIGIDALLGLGARVAILLDDDLPQLLRRLDNALSAEHRRRLFVCAGAALYGFDRRGAPVALSLGPPGAGGALAALVAQVVTALRIAAHDQLVVAPERDAGPPPELASAVQASAGPERLCEILELQRELTRELGVFAPPRDAAWTVEQPGFDVAREHEIESLMTIANGYLGSRGSIAEGSSVSRPATFIAGAFEPSADISRVPELVIAPDWGRLRFIVEDEPFSIEKSELLRSRRDLDLRGAVLLCERVGRGMAGYVTHVRTLHAASLADRHVLLEAVRIAPRNFTGTVLVDAILSGDVRSASGAAHWESFTTDARAESLLLVGRTYGGLVTAVTSHLRVQPASPGGDGPAAARAPDEEKAHCRRVACPRAITERCALEVRVGEARDLHRTATLHTSRDVDDPRRAGESLQAALAARPFDSALGDHRRAWAERWRRADVEIDGAPGLERALRFALYHLIGTANPDDPRCSVGARGLSGEAYRGHVFWDTEIFLTPFYTHCYPEAARAQLLYRHRTIAGARRKARSLGYDGALYAWESADTGDETTPAMVVTPFGEVMRVLSGEQEHHISADVAYAALAYTRATGDVAFERGEGLEILVETARFWASRAALEADGRAHIRQVIGPDEYHEGVDDNAFTNWMARRNLRAAADAALRGGAGAEVLERIALRPDEPRRWRAIADRMALGLDPATGLIEQFAGYFGLEPFAIADYAVRSAPIDMLLGRERTQRCQVVKQADVVQLLALLWSEVPPATRRACFLYYEPRTAHGSSLSPGIHALVAARLDLHAQAARYFEQTADIDLGSSLGNAAGGVHIAAMGSLWQAVAFGVAGLTRVPRPQVERALPDRPRPARAAGDAGDTAIGIEPHLLPGWRHLKIPIAWRGRTLEIHVEPGAIEVAVEGDGSLPICWLDAGAPVRAIEAEPGRRYAARRTGVERGAWEEIAR